MTIFGQINGTYFAIDFTFNRDHHLLVYFIYSGAVDYSVIKGDIRDAERRIAGIEHFTASLPLKSVGKRIADRGRHTIHIYLVAAFRFIPGKCNMILVLPVQIEVASRDKSSGYRLIGIVINIAAVKLCVELRIPAGSPGQ